MATGVPSSVTQSPTMRNFAAMKRFVVNYVQGADDAELLQLAGDAINSGIDRINTRVWEWNIRRQAITLTASTAEYSVNSNFKKPRKLVSLNSSSQMVDRIIWREPKSFLDYHGWSTSEGTPEIYTVESPKHYGKLILEPSPSDAYVAANPTLRLYYYARVPNLSQDGDTLDTPPEVWSVVAWHARWDLALIRGLAGSMVDRAYAHWRETEKALIEDDRNTSTDWE